MPFLGSTHTCRLDEGRGLGILHIPGGLLLDQQARSGTETTGRWSTTGIVIIIGPIARGGRGTGRAATVVEPILGVGAVHLCLGRGPAKGREGRSNGIQRNAAF